MATQGGDRRPSLRSPVSPVTPAAIGGSSATLSAAGSLRVGRTQAPAQFEQGEHLGCQNINGVLVGDSTLNLVTHRLILSWDLL